MADHRDALPQGTRLGSYELGMVLSTDDLGIKYHCVDQESGRRLAVCEYLPTRWVTREAGGRLVPTSSSARARFDESARQVLRDADLSTRFKHSSFVAVHETVEANDTVYVVMDYVAGDTLSWLAKRNGPVPTDKLREWIDPLVDGLDALHRCDLLHRDIRPRNIVVTESGLPVLLTFGLAQQASGGPRQAFGSGAGEDYRAIHSASAYVPIESYASRGRIGPRADIYGLAATLYFCATAREPRAALDRVIEDDLLPLAELAPPGDERDTLAAIDAGLALRAEDRPRGAATWRKMLSAGARDDSESLIAVRRTSARAPRRVQDGRDEVSTKRGWALPAVGLVAATALITYLDAGLLRSGNGEVEGVDAVVPHEVAQDAQSPSVPSDTVVADALTGVEDESTSPGEAADEAGTPDGVAAAADFDAAPESHESDEDVSAEAGGGPGEGSATSLDVEDVGGASDIADATDESAEDVAPAFRGTRLVVVTEPPSVDVLLDGELVGQTPLDLPDLSSGVYDVALRRRHYEPIDLGQQQFEPSGELRIARTLVRGAGDLRVVTQPPGAWVEWRGGRLTETTPLTMRALPAGAVELVIGAAGYRDAVASAEVLSGGVGHLERVLAVAYGTLTLDLEPDDAAVSILSVENIPYVPGVELPEGTHRLEVAGEGYRTESMDVTVSGDTLIDVSLEPDGQGEDPVVLALERAVTDTRVCVALLRRETAAVTYPGSRPQRRPRDYGSARMLVKFAIDEQGAVLDSGVTVDRGRSSAQQPEYFDRFVAAAIAGAKDFRFTFDDSATCERDQSMSLMVHFSFE